MPGLWLTRIARRLAREDTFERLVSPAIADLQREAGRGLLLRAYHYVAITIVMGWALLTDVAAGLAIAFDAEAVRRVWTRVAVWSLAGGFVNWLLIYTLTLRELNRWHVDPSVSRLVLSGVIFKSFLPALTVAAIVGAYSLKRRHTGQRSVVMATTVVLAAAAFITTYASITLGAPAQSAWEQATRAQLSQLSQPIAFMRPPLQWQMFMSAVSIVPFAWLGVVLARRRSWALAFSAMTILGTWQAALFSGAAFRLFWFLVELAPGPVPVTVGQYFPLGGLTLAGVILLWRTVESRVDSLRHQPSGSPPESTVGRSDAGAVRSN